MYTQTTVLPIVAFRPSLKDFLRMIEFEFSIFSSSNRILSSSEACCLNRLKLLVMVWLAKSPA